MKLLRFFLISKTGIIAFILLAFYMGPHDVNLWNRWYTRNALNDFYLPFVNWDGQHYLLLSDWGYNVWEHSRAFFPLFPLLIRGLNTFVHNFIYSGFIIVLLASAGLTYFMKCFASHYGDDEQSYMGTVLLLLWPSSFFFSVVYSEALFVFLMIAFLYFYHVKHSYISLAFAVLLPFTKGQALFLVMGISIDILWRLLRRPHEVDKVFAAANLLAFACGGIVYLVFFKLVTGAYLSGIEAQSTFVLGFSTKNLINPFHLINYLFSEIGPLFAFNNALIDRIFIIAMLLGLIPVIRTKDSFLISCYATMTYCLASLGQGGAFTRYSILLAPFLLVSLQRQHRYITWTYGLGFISLQLFFGQRFAQGFWVG